MLSFYQSEQEIVEELVSELTIEDIKDLRNMTKSELIKLHHSTGRYIRNHYLLWHEDNPLTDNNAILIDGVDHNPKHPDAVSMRIIHQVWETVNASTSV